MAMNEDSVVSSLNELRRMANDRARRETEARARVEDRSGSDQRGHGGRRSDGRARPNEMRPSAGGGYQDGNAAADVHRTLLGGHAIAGQQQWQPEAEGRPTLGGYGQGYGYSHTAQPATGPETYQEPPRQKSAVGPVLLTILILGGAAGGGYWKLQQDWQATLRSRDQALLAAEEGRNRAVELASRAEQLAKVQLALSDQRAKTGAAERAATPAPTAAPAAAAAGTVASTPAPASAKPVASVVAKPAKVERGKRGRRAAAAARRGAMAARMAPVAAPAPLEDKKPVGGVPKIAGKKKLNDDPLAGLKL